MRDKNTWIAKILTFVLVLGILVPTGTRTIVQAEETTLTYQYMNVDTAIFTVIDTEITWDPTLVTFDRIQSDAFVIIELQSKVEEGKLVLSYDYVNGVRESEPKVTIYFTNCFSDSTKASSTKIHSSYG